MVTGLYPAVWITTLSYGTWTNPRLNTPLSSLPNTTGSLKCRCISSLSELYAFNAMLLEVCVDNFFWRKVASKMASANILRNDCIRFWLTQFFTSFLLL